MLIYIQIVDLELGVALGKQLYLAPVYSFEIKLKPLKTQFFKIHFAFYFIFSNAHLVGYYFKYLGLSSIFCPSLIMGNFLDIQEKENEQK